MLDNIDLKKLKQLNNDELDSLAEELRNYIIEVVSKNGGHLASNLGMIELTIALHKVFDAPHDKIIYDVSHQTYAHKILTGRKNEFKTLRKLNGISGFSKYSESEYDAYEAGHSSTAISAGLGYLEAKKNDIDSIGNVVAVVGDASIVNGLSFEALNYITMHPDMKMIIILNDNEMGISKNQATFNISDLFSALGFEYYGIIDGHDILELIRYLEMSKIIRKSVVIHVKTKKGKGYLPAENDKEGIWHGVNDFDIETGKINFDEDLTTYGKELSSYLIDYVNKSKNGSKIRVITPAMSLGSGLDDFAKECENNFIDVGLAEENACLMAASMAHSGLTPIVFCYSTFLQRAYDEIVHDIARANEHVIICIDHAGIVSNDGDTHQGIFDLGYLYSIPNMMILAPNDASSAISMMKYAIEEVNSPVVIRYSKEKITHSNLIDKFIPKWICTGEGNKTIITYGVLYNEVKEFINDNNIKVKLVNAVTISPLDEELLKDISNDDIIVYEDVYHNGSLGDRIISYYNDLNIKTNVKRVSLKNTFLETGTRKELLEKYNISLDDLKKAIGD